MRIFSNSVWVFAIAGLGWGASWRTPEAKLTPPASAPNFGESMVVIGNTAFLGSDGAVFVYQRSAGSWSDGTALPTDGLQGSHFGNMVSGDGQYLAVADKDNGQVYIYDVGGKAQVQVAKLKVRLNTDVSYDFDSIALSGSTLLVGFSKANFVSVYVRGLDTWGTTTPFVNTQAPNRFGWSVAISGDTAVVGAPDAKGTGGVYVYQRTDDKWAPQFCSCGGSSLSAIITPPDPNVVDFGSTVAVNGNTIFASSGVTTGSQPVPEPIYAFFRQNGTWGLESAFTSGWLNGVGIAVSGDLAVATPASASPGMVPLFARSGAYWSAEPPLAGIGPNFGSSVAFSGDTLLVAATNDNAVYAYHIWNVSLTSSPPGRPFTASGAGCVETGAFFTPYDGLWTNCTVQFDATDTNPPETRYTFQGWADGGSQNPRTFSAAVTTLDAPYAFTGEFLTEYEVTTQAVPVSGGSVTGSGWYTAGGRAVIIATPNPGFLFTGFSGALSGFTTPQTLTVNAPQTVTGSFAATPPAVLNATISAKSGAAADRIWTISVTNAGPGTAYNAQLFAMAFTQTFGAACTALPVRLTPAAFPLGLGSLAPQSSAAAQVAFDFTGCPANARFTVNIGYASNGGASGGMIQLVNQFQ